MGKWQKRENKIKIRNSEKDKSKGNKIKHKNGEKAKKHKK